MASSEASEKALPMGCDRLLQLDPSGDRASTVRGERPDHLLEQAGAVTYDLSMEKRIILVEANEVDLRSCDRRERAREGELVIQRKLGVDG